MNESRRMEMINQFMDSFSDKIVGFNNTVFDAMQSLNAELENVQSNAQVPYNEPANFNKFTKKYKQEFFEEQYRKQAERNQEVEASTNSINNRMDAVKRAASLGVNEVIAESSRELESMRTFRNRMQAELDDLQSELSSKKQQFSEIIHNDALSMEERQAQIAALREPGLNARIEELTGKIASIDAFSEEVEKLSSLDVENNENIEEVLFEVAQNLEGQVKTRAESKGTVEEAEEVVEEVAEEVTQEQAQEQTEEAAQTVVNPEEPTPKEVVEEMDEEQIRRRMAELMGLSYDEFVNREIKYEVSNPGKNFINDIYPHDIEYQMDDWAVDEFNDLRDKLHQIKGMNVETQDPTNNRIDEIRKRMGELLGIPPFDGIENENEHAIEYQMDDWAIDEFQELRDELRQLLNQEKANEAPTATETPVAPTAAETEEVVENAPVAPTEAQEEVKEMPEIVTEDNGEREFSTEAPGLNFNARKTANTNAKRVIGKRKAGIAIVLGGAALTGLVATSLFGVPVASAVLCGAAVLGTAEILDTATRVAREKAVTRNLKKFADKMGLEVVYDYSAGTVDFAKAVKNGDKYEYIPVKDKKEMYEIAESKGLSREETDALFRKCTRKPVTNPFAAVGRGIKDLFIENKDGYDLDVIGLTGTNAYQNGLADLYSEFGGIRITDPQIEQEEIENDIKETHEKGKSKIEQNIAKLKNTLENADKYNLTDAQRALIVEAIERQEAIQNNLGHRVMRFLKNMPIVKNIQSIKARLKAGRSEVAEEEIEQDQEQTQENEEVAEEQTVIPENEEVVQEAAEEVVEQAEEQAQEQAQENEEVVENAEEVQEEQTEATTAQGSTEEVLENIESNLNDELDRLLGEDSLISDEEEREQTQEAPAEAATAEETNTNVVNPDVVEQLRTAPDQTSVDMMVEQMRDANIPEENIEAALNQAGMMQQQDQGRTLGL